MWLLSTARAELHYFPSPESVKDGYAILSHVWGPEEQSFKAIQKLRKRCGATGENPRSLACAKIRQCCELAERHGFKWLWMDTCCIDKSSSAELSEAVNSMFRYYSLAQICYAYLEDVPSSSDSELGSESEVQSARSYGLRWTRWNKRGWTLQELVAPRIVIFLSRTWEMLGSKADFAGILENATGIPARLLRLEASLGDFSVAQRMSWAAHRETTRVEDEAYCLLGIFDINMPTLYGEGRRAFQRLQEEIMKQSHDTTLFAWGDPLPTLVIDLALQKTASLLLTEPTSASHLFAQSPFAFKGCERVSCRSLRRDPWTDEEWNLPLGGSQSYPDTGSVTLSITPHGVRAHIPVVDCGLWSLADLGWHIGQNRLFLLLTYNFNSSDALRPSFCIGFPDGPTLRARLVAVTPADGDSLLGNALGYTSWTWKEVNLLQSPPAHSYTQTSVTGSVPIPPMLFNQIMNPPFRFPESNIRSLLNNLDRYWTFGQYRLSSVIALEGSRPAVFTFTDPMRVAPLVIRVGVCKSHPPMSPSSPGRHEYGALWATAHWASMWETPDPSSGDREDHACPADHVRTWPGLSRTFDPHCPITLSFAPCPLNPRSTLVLHASCPLEDQPRLCGSRS
ncbi:HET-domain-containing protein [Lentinus tigrinus ALCF2SS1-7]|uniref:HET-domain-containing protein n=1 Tax=Lentinus tigrinus ALCF2SS1-6 TaxID=1328759 RepID=A0A5C2S4S9_9APHY|nr:HET-domain-containing protein [Lentinus tigrinus ALCF2SS1-6]RPD70449.1 HET-domain-containing protein [Lentinus tigrinus ALCF2SS1-7]